jgi:hypothetical protein
MKTYCALVLFLLTAIAIPAQPSPAAPDATPAAARVSFELRWPAANPSWFELVFQPDGSARYRSLPHQDSKPDAKPDDPVSDPFELTFTLSPRSRQLVFALVPQLPRLQGSLDKLKVAFTGAKTVRYDDADGNHSVLSYNYSSSSELSAFTQLMQGISETIELSQLLQFQLRLDTLAVDATLRRAEDLISNHRLSEPQLLEPVLQRITNDPAIMNVARQRARHLRQAAPAAIQR